MKMHKFWSDDFDMDLVKVFPDFPRQIGKAADIPLWTVGHSSYGRLNSPCQWNSHGAFVWSEKPELERDVHGWFNVWGCVGNDPVIECTWLELLRDQWPHHYNFILLPQQVKFDGPDWLIFERIMYHRRGWRFYASHEADMNQAQEWALRATRQLLMTAKSEVQTAQ